MSDATSQALAERRADARRGFYIHLAVYILVNALLIWIDLTRSPGTYWFYWPLGGWGIGIVFHALGVFVLGDKSRHHQQPLERESKS